MRLKKVQNKQKVTAVDPSDMPDAVGDEIINVIKAAENALPKPMEPVNNTNESEDQEE